MNNEILLRLTGLMEKLGFNCGSGTFTKAEMCAYAAGISLVKSTLDSGFDEIFTDTMKNKGFLMYCDLLGIENTGDEQEMKDKIISRLSDKCYPLSNSEYNSAINSTEGYSELYTPNKGKCFMIQPVNKKTLSAFSYLMKNYFPAYRYFEASGQGLSFDFAENLQLRWYEIEELDIPFKIWNTLSDYD